MVWHNTHMKTAKTPELTTPLQRNLHRLMTAQGHTMRSLSDAAGLGETAVRDIIVGRSRRPSYRQLESIATALTVPVAALTEHEVASAMPERVTTPQSVETGAVSDSTLKLPLLLRAEPVELGKPDLPVIGRAAGGRGELMIARDAAPVAWTWRPPQLRGLDGVFAVYATGTSMVPMYRPGQTIVARIDMPLSAGDGVVVEKQNDEAMIKEFVRYAEEGIEVKEYRPKERHFTVRFSEIRRVSRIYAALDFR
jgi:phage repressor protein C with HTH and peptisase S24 domain